MTDPDRLGGQREGAIAVPGPLPADPAGYEYHSGDEADWTAEVSDGGITAAGPSASPPPPVPQDPAEPPPVTAAAAVRRRRRRWGVPVAVIAVVAVLGLSAGLVIWAPWHSPPLLRPAGLTVGPSTTSSVMFRWSRPATGPAPDRYVILHDGKVIGSVPGTVTNYHAAGLAPATAYRYRVAAVRGGKRSALSSVLVVSTSTPPLSAARLQGRWAVTIKIVRGGADLKGPGSQRWTESWLASPKCPAGPCAMRLSGRINGYRFKATLTRAGAVYTGKTTANVFPCGSGANSFPIQSTLTIRVTVTAAQVGNRAWTASSWAGTMVVSAPYTSSGAYYCTASRLTASLSANP
jgi:fibronectin type III domain protein